MMGGDTTVGSFLDARAIDEFLSHVVPPFIGEGIPLVAPRCRAILRRLKSTRRYPDGVMHLHYAVGRERNVKSL